MVCASFLLQVFSFRNEKDLRKFVRHKRKYARGGARDDKQYAFNPEFWCHVWDWVHHRKLKPTTGMAGVVLALHGCDRGQVDRGSGLRDRTAQAKPYG